MIERTISRHTSGRPQQYPLRWPHAASEPVNHQMPLINKQPHQAPCFGTAIAIWAINRLRYGDGSMIAAPHHQPAGRVQCP
jgi:hypothetical protein